MQNIANALNKSIAFVLACDFQHLYFEIVLCGQWDSCSLLKGGDQVQGQWCSLVVEHLPCIYKVLGSNSNNTKTKQNSQMDPHVERQKGWFLGRCTAMDMVHDYFTELLKLGHSVAPLVWLRLTVDTAVCHILTMSDTDMAWRSFLKEGNRTHIFLWQHESAFTHLRWIEKLHHSSCLIKWHIFSPNLASLPLFGLLQLLVCISGG